MESLNLSLLQGKNIALGVCGSVAIYKSIEIMRNLQKLGANVRVVMSESAQKFINPLLFEAISHHNVLTKDLQSWGETPNNHIELATWADSFLIAPCSANTLNKLALGIADNVLLESVLAFDKQKLIAPAANTKMLENPATQESLTILQSRGFQIIAPQCKELACQTIGNGALAQPLEITCALIRTFYKNPFWEKCAVCVSGGGSKEAIDSVRFISNFSSGKMGASLALAAYFLGAKVFFLAPQLPFPLPLEITHKKVESTHDYLEAITLWQAQLKEARISKNCAFLLMSAAISDYIPQEKIQGKLKKQDIGQSWQLNLRENTDILATIPKLQKTIGFKLEAQNGIANAKSTLSQKGLDAICLNTITKTHNPLESQSNRIAFITNKEVQDLGFHDKLDLAFMILQKAQML